MNIIGKKNLYFALSLLILIPGSISILLFGLNLSIDFTGGSRLTLAFSKTVNNKIVDTARGSLERNSAHVVTTQQSGNHLFIRTAPIDQKKHEVVLKTLKKDIGAFTEESFETIGPTIGAETLTNAMKALVFSSVLIVLYIAWSFRQVPKPANSFRFGICAIIALLHDVLVVVGTFSILGHFFHVEVDSLFVTALLTIIGFSVHDTIVVFDRIRENLRRMPQSSFSHIVNESIIQTLGRSVNTSLTVLLVLFALLLFGGESITWFIVALLVGIASGTYSSIFNAAPLLVVWEEWSRRRTKVIY